MKTIYKFFGLVGMGCLALTSCNNDEFLDLPKRNLIGIEGEFQSNEGAVNALTGIYDLMNANDGPDGDWGFKPNLFSGCHPTMDTQATGWDKNFNTQSWDAMTTELNSGWAHAYAAIARANLYLDGLSKATIYPDNIDGSVGIKQSVATQAEGEARAIRGFFYTYLAQTWGRVPMLNTGEDYNNAPTKAKAETYDEMWDFIISDFKAAADMLDWEPVNPLNTTAYQYGRATKGMALSYLADAYLWKAYRRGGLEKNQNLVDSAKTCLQKVYDSGIYKLNPSFCTNWDCEGGGWNDECIWAEILDEGGNYSGWSDRTSSLMTKWYTACPENGGWGSLYLSWEWYASYEHGDKRRDASCVTGAIDPAIMAKYGIEESKYVHGYHPFLQVNVGNGANSKTKRFHFDNGEYAPSIWSTKFWRNSSAEDLNGVGTWGWCMWSPTAIYWKRFSNVIIDLAECNFVLGNDAEGWRLLDEVRKRAFGFNESELEGKDANYVKWFNVLANKYGKAAVTKYPIPFGSQIETSEYVDAKTYYTAYKSNPLKVKLGMSGAKAYTSPAWKVAVNEERRKEFNCEWCLRPDMQRSGFMEEHIEVAYPVDETAGADLLDYPWTPRTFTYDDRKMDMPIPQDEIDKNPACEQNEAY